MRRKKGLKKGIIFGILAVIVFTIFNIQPTIAEKLYGQIVYPTFQLIRSILSYISPVPLIYIVLIIFLFYLFRQLYKLIVRKPTILHFLHKILGIIGYLIFFFYVLWGFNYARPSLAEKMNLPIVQPDSAYIVDEYQYVVNTLNKTRDEIESDTIAWYGMDRTEILNQVRPELKDILREHQYPTAFPTFVYNLKPAGILLRLKTSGFYFPYSGEGYIDAGLPDISVPNTIAHELAHVYGVTNEGESNFLAYRACIENRDPFINYSGLLSYYHYAARAMRNLDKNLYEEIKAELNPIVIKDFTSKYKALNQYKDFMPQSRDLIYDKYLKVQGVKDGLTDYSKVFMLEYAYKQRNSE